MAAADFTEEEKHPLLKSKFGVYVCTYVAADRILKDMELMKELKPGGFRYDLGWGFGNDNSPNSPRELNAPQISGGMEKLHIDFTDMDRLTDKLCGQGVDIMYVHAYNPLPLQKPASEEDRDLNGVLRRHSRWNTKPADMAAWEQINYEYAHHWRERGRRVKYYEIWNEPDLQPVFFDGTMEDFFEIYKYGVRGIKRADPDALVGGPAISFDQAWIVPFLAYVKEQGLPLDFFSYHTYGNPAETVSEIRSVLQSVPDFADIDILLTEYNSFVPATEDFTVNGKIERYCAASRLLHDFHFFLEQDDIKTVYWAQLDDPEVFGEGVDRCGLISLGGHKKAAFHAYGIYADMPEERSALTISSPEIEGFAAADHRRACIALWNMSDSGQTVEVQARGLLFAHCRLSVYRIDSKHGSYCDNPLEEDLVCVESRDVPNIYENVQPLWRGALEGNSVVYLTVEDEEGQDQDEGQSKGQSKGQEKKQNKEQNKKQRGVRTWTGIM